MKNIVLGFILFFFSNISISQDILITTKIFEKEVLCEKIILKNDTISYLPVGKQTISKTPLSKISYIKFYGQNISLGFPEIKLDTVYGTITKISPHMTYYVEDNGVWKIKERNYNLFACYFDGTIPDSIILNHKEQYEKTLFTLKNRTGFNILLKNDKQVQGQLLSINDDRIILKNINDEHKQEYSNLFFNQIKQISRKGSIYKTRPSGVYYLSNNGSILKTSKIIINPRSAKIDLKYPSGASYSWEKRKDDLGAFIFYDYNNNYNKKRNNERPPTPFMSKSYCINISVNYSKLIDKIPSENDLYNFYQDLKNGIGVSIDANYQTKGNLGIGGLAYYSLHNASLTDIEIIDRITEQTITDISTEYTTFYFGPNLLLRSIGYSTFTNEISISAGVYHIKNISIINQVEDTFKATSFGLYLHERPGIFITDNGQSIYLDISLFLGKINKIRKDNSSVEILEEPLTTSQINLGVGVKF